MCDGFSGGTNLHVCPSAVPLLQIGNLDGYGRKSDRKVLTADVAGLAAVIQDPAPAPGLGKHQDLLPFPQLSEPSIARSGSAADIERTGLGLHGSASGMLEL